MGERMTADLAGDALKMALSRRKSPQGVITHSDRGSQYCSTLYQTLLMKYELTCSMSAKGNCYDCQSFRVGFIIDPEDLALVA